MMNSSDLLAWCLSALALLPCIVCVITWVYVLVMAQIMRSSTAHETDREEIEKRYSLVFHDDLIGMARGAMRQLVRGLFWPLVLLVVWYFFCTASEQQTVLFLMSCLALLNGGMWLLARAADVIMQLMARTKVAAMHKLRQAFGVSNAKHMITLVLTVIIYWLLTL